MATNANVANVVSKGELTVSKVVRTLQSRGTFSLFRKNLCSVNLSLDGDMDLYSTMNKALILDMKELPEVVYTLILSWASKKKEKATLDVLIKALEDNGMNDCAESLEELKTADGSTEQLIVNFPDVPDGTLSAEDEKLQNRWSKLKS